MKHLNVVKKANLLKEWDVKTPIFGAKLNTDYILDMVKMEGGIKILLDIDRVLSEREIAILENAS